jgi:poly(beta-D-mannuronate) lyase
MRRVASIGLVSSLCAIGVAGCTPSADSPPPPRGSATVTSAAAAPAPAGREVGAVLRSPFDVEARRRAVGVPLLDPAPEALIPPIRDLRGVSFYIDKDHSIADPALKRQNEEAVRPVRAFVARVTGLADDWMRSSPAKPAYAARALDQLAGWAAAGALLGDVNKQGSYERKWTLGSLALAFLKVRTAPGLDAAKRAATTEWLVHVARAVMPPYDDLRESSSRNNHAYWAGLAVASVGIAAEDRTLLDWGIARAKMGLADVRPDGTLPLEMERGKLALHYHAFALPPLVLLAEIGEANGIPLYEANDGALKRLAGVVLAGMADPASFGTLAGTPQTFPLETHPRPAYFAWGEAYYARFRDPRLLRWLASGMRPLVDARLGGDQTLAFGVEPLPAPP